MGETRIDNSTPRTFSECDEETGLCGEVKKPEPQVTKADPQISHPGDDWHAPMLPQEKPAQMAQIAKNMSTPKPPTDSELRAPYEKMSDAELEKEVNTLSKRLSGGDQYSGADLDTRKFHIAEAVAKERADKAHVEQDADKSVPASQLYAGKTKGSLGYEAGFALQNDEKVTVLQGGAEFSTRHVGPKGAVYHEQKDATIAGVDVSVTTDVGTTEYGFGLKNADGSKGFHIGGAASIAGAEVTAHKQGVGSVTVGAGPGAAAELSVGGKKDGASYEVCARVATPIITVGTCFPVWTGRN